MKSHTTVTIPFDDRIIVVSLLDYAQFSMARLRIIIHRTRQGRLVISASLPSDRRGAATRKASTSSLSLDTSRSLPRSLVSIPPV